MHPNRRLLRIALGVIPALFCAVAALQFKIDAQPAIANSESEDLLLSSPDAVKRLTLGYDSLMADVYWTRAVQLYGKNVGQPNADFHLLWPLLNVATTLDPKLVAAYHFGAVFLSEPARVGAGRTDLAVNLVKKGIEANPDNWQLGTDLGFLYYWRLKDYASASAAYLRTSKIPGAPSWIAIMAARIALDGGSLDTSRVIWTQIYNSSNDPSLKKQAYRELEGLRAQQDMLQLDKLAEQYKARFGRYPASSAEMSAAALLPGVPVDPAGFAYEFDADGRARLNSKTTYIIPPQPKVLSAPTEK